MIFSKKSYFIFIVILILMIFISYFTLDREVSLYFIKHADTYKHFGKIVSIVGESQWYIGIAVLGSLYYYLTKKNSLYLNRFLFLLYINLFSGVISLFLKMFFARLRPWKLENGGDAYGFLIFQEKSLTLLERLKHQLYILIHDSTPNTSFPSGHTTTMFAIFTYMSILFPKYLYLWLSLATIGALSRVLANDHFISDILAGVLVGTLSTLFIYIKMKDKIEKHY